MTSSYTFVRFSLALSLMCLIVVWFALRPIRAEWQNVPPVPSELSLAFSTLGDDEFSYRSTGVMIQNLGNTGGRWERLQNYNYERLAEWLFLSFSLNERSDFLPFLTAYNFSANKDADELIHIVRYLERASDGVGPEKWRWLAQAAVIARFKMNDLELALELAEKLTARDDPDLPYWARAMPAFVKSKQGDKQAALDFLYNMLESSAQKMHPSEVNATVNYICNTLLEPEGAQNNELCSEDP